MKSSSILFLTPFILNLLRYLLIAGTAFIIFYILFSQKFNGNYGLYFRVWDRIMKTENPSYFKTFDAIQQKRFGNKTKLDRLLL